MKNGMAVRKGSGWIKLLGILTVVGLLVAVARIVLRVFREQPATGEDGTESDEVHGV